MKIRCLCGGLIPDATDGQPHKARLLPDQDWLPTWDALDEQVLGPLAAGTIDRGAAYRLTLALIGRTVRAAYQCSACARLCVKTPGGTFQFFAPEKGDESLGVFRGRDR